MGNPIRFIGVPKTIDNDLEGTDHTPGYGSAAKYIATVTKELVRDGLIYEMQSVTVIEIMGRNAGWLTGAAVLAKSEDCEGPDLIYLPEVDLDVDDFLKKVRKLVSEKQSIVIAVAERKNWLRLVCTFRQDGFLRTCTVIRYGQIFV